MTDTGERKPLNPNTAQEARHALHALRNAYLSLDALENPLTASYLLQAFFALGNVVKWVAEANE